MNTHMQHKIRRNMQSIAKKGYKMDPYEKAAFKAEKDWRKYI